MAAVWIILIIIMLVLAVALFAWVTIEIDFKKNELNKSAEIWIGYLFFKKKVYPPKHKSVNKKKEQSKQQSGDAKYIDYVKRMLKSFEILKDDIVEILRFCSDKMIRIKSIEFDFAFGLEDPMYTGLANGLIYGTVYNILGIIHNNTRLESCHVDIAPDFERVCHNLRFHCILHLKNVHIIVMVVKAAKMYGKIRKMAENA